MKAWLLVTLLGLGPVLADAAPTIPSLAWEKRSDWVSVKEVSPAAAGDGVTDDTAAIQGALDVMHRGSVLYFPPGAYRLTDTVHLTPVKRLTGILIVGHGRDTKLEWDGPAGRPMLIIGGATASRFVGLSFDGNHKATVGLYHLTKFFETEVHHRNLAFYNFTNAGILAEKSPATAETMTENCLFVNCHRGLACTSFNDYDYTIDGCEFRHCDLAVDCRHGNVYVRNCHFEGSTDTDIYLNPEHGSSVRRCTSLGSATFLRFVNPVAPLTIENCLVAGWTHPGGAIQLGGAPVLVFDCTFADPPTADAPIHVTPASQRLFISNVTAPGEVVSSGARGHLYRIPPGRLHGSLTSAKQSFLKSNVDIPGKVFDAKRDFGAKGDGRTDDTAAIQQTIDAARHFGQGAIAYLPTGIYVITSTLEITGSNYHVGGTGLSSGLLWKGPQGGTMITVTDAPRLTLRNLAVGNHDTALKMTNAIDILQTGGAIDSHVTYDNVLVFGMYQKQPSRKGLWLRDLRPEDTVLMAHVQGNIHLVDASRSTVLMGNTYEGSVTIEGKSPKRGGFIGIITRLSTLCTHALYVKDSHSLVASDFYIEQANNGFSFSGSPGDPPGRLVIASPKFHTNSPESVAIDIDGYQGSVSMGPSQFYCQPRRIKLRQRGKPSPVITLWSSSFYRTSLTPDMTYPAALQLIGNQAIGKDLGADRVAGQRAAEALRQLPRVLDDLRRLGQIDLQLNHPNVQ